MVYMIFSRGHEKYSIYNGHEKTAMVDTNQNNNNIFLVLYIYKIGIFFCPSSYYLYIVQVFKRTLSKFKCILDTPLFTYTVDIPLGVRFITWTHLFYLYTGHTFKRTLGHTSNHSSPLFVPP